MSRTTPVKPVVDLTRRSFLRNGATGAVALSLVQRNASAAEASDAINIALVGFGAQGQTLIWAIQKAVGVKVRWIAVCDVLGKKAQSAAAQVSAKNASGGLNAYTDIDLMLKEHPEIDAVFLAVPDWMHAPYVQKCHAAGKQVYCEKMMSNTLEAAQSMVRSQRDSGLLLQIGHQRRSNPRYQFARNELMRKLKVCGRITHAYGQWNRGVTVPINAKYSEEEVKIIVGQGYKDVFEYLNWRYYRKYGGGPYSDLGAHQIDIFNWMFGVTPRSVVVSGGKDYYQNINLDKSNPDAPRITYEHPDNVIAVYEYDVPDNGLVRVVYQVVTTNSSMTAYEKYMGDGGTMVLGEVDSFNQVYREKWDSDLAKWEEGFFKKGYLKKSSGNIKHKFWEKDRSSWLKADPWLDREGVVDVRASAPLDPYEMPVSFNLPYHTPHVANFLETVHKKGKQTDLNCPVEDAYKCAVAVIKVNELALNGGGKITFKAEDFIVP